MSGRKLPLVRRVVTGHDANGQAVFTSDEGFEPQAIPSGDADFALIWTTAAVPADNNDDVDGRVRGAGLTLNGGSVLRIVDIHPGCASPLHRTNSIDYGVVLSGKIELELDHGVRTQIGVGGMIIQRGTMHLWRNTSATTPCRIAFVLIEAKARVHNGNALPEVNP